MENDENGTFRLAREKRTKWIGSKIRSCIRQQMITTMRLLLLMILCQLSFMC